MAAGGFITEKEIDRLVTILDTPQEVIDTLSRYNF